MQLDLFAAADACEHDVPYRWACEVCDAEPEPPFGIEWLESTGLLDP